MYIWDWLNANVGAVTIIFLVATLALNFISNRWGLKPLFSRASLVVKVGVTESTVPTDLLDWMQDLSEAVNRADDGKGGGQKESNSEDLGRRDAQIWRLGSSLHANRLQGIQEINKVALKLINRTSGNLENVRVKLNSSRSDRRGFWIDLKGDYLTPSESENYLQKIDWQQSGNVVLPPLPEIPAKATMEIIYYGPISVNTYPQFPVEVATAGFKNRVRWMMPDQYQNIERVQNPWHWLAVGVSGLFVALIVSVLLTLMSYVVQVIL